MKRLLQSLSSFAARGFTQLTRDQPSDVRRNQPADTAPLSLYVAKRWSQRQQLVYWNPQKAR